MRSILSPAGLVMLLGEDYSLDNLQLGTLWREALSIKIPYYMGHYGTVLYPWPRTTYQNAFA